GVVDQDVDAPEGRHGALDQRLDLRGLAGVAGDGHGGAAGGGDALGDLLQALDLARGQHHARALRGEADGDGLADAAAGAGDDGGLAVETEAGDGGGFAHGRARYRG